MALSFFIFQDNVIDARSLSQMIDHPAVFVPRDCLYNNRRKPGEIPALARNCDSAYRG